MKTNFRKLRLMIAMGVINEEDYYNIDVNPGEIIFQGCFSLELMAKTASLFYPMDDQYDGFVRYQRGDVKIVLT